MHPNDFKMIFILDGASVSGWSADRRTLRIKNYYKNVRKFRNFKITKTTDFAIAYIGSHPFPLTRNLSKVIILGTIICSDVIT